MKKLLALTLSLLLVFSAIPMALISAEAQTVSNVILDFEDKTGIGKHVGDAGSSYKDVSTLPDTFAYWKESAGAYSASVNGKSNYASFNLPTDWYSYYDADLDATLTKPNAISFEVTCSSTSKSAEVSYVGFDTAPTANGIADSTLTGLTITGTKKASSKTKATITCAIPVGLDLSKFTRFVVRIWGTNDSCYVDNITLIYPLAYVASFQGTETAVLAEAVEDEALEFSKGETTITMPSATLADGKTFAGWVSEDDTATVIAAGTEVVLEDDATYYAVATDRPAYATPVVPVVTEITKNSATLEATDGYVYSLDGLTWQASNVFTGLAADTEYTFYQKVAGTPAYLESAVSEGTKATTPAIFSIVFQNSEVVRSDNTMGANFGNNDGYPNITKSGLSVGQSVTLTSVLEVNPGIYDATLFARSYSGRAPVDVEINGTVVAESLDTSAGGTGDFKNMAFALGSIVISEIGPVVIKFTTTGTGSIYMNSLDLLKTSDYTGKFSVVIDGEEVAQVEKNGEYTVPTPPEHYYYTDGTTNYYGGEVVIMNNKLSLTTVVETTTTTYTMDEGSRVSNAWTSQATASAEYVEIDGDWVLKVPSKADQYTCVELPEYWYDKQDYKPINLSFSISGTSGAATNTQYVRFAENSSNTKYVSISEGYKSMQSSYSVDITPDLYGYRYLTIFLKGGSNFASAFDYIYIDDIAVTFEYDPNYVAPEKDGETSSAVETEDKASIRLDADVQGIRFYSSINIEGLDVVEAGTLIGPTDLVGNYLTFDDVSVENAVVVPYDLLKGLYDDKYVVGSIVGIKAKNYARDFSARAYVVLADGTVMYSETTSTRNMAAIADAYIADENSDFESLDAELKAKVELWAKAND